MVGFTPLANCRLIALVVGLLLLPAGRAQDRVTQLQAEFERESDPVRKAKLVPKLGDAQLEQVQKAVERNDYAPALQILLQYRDNVRSAEAALKASGLNAEEKPNGFKQLQIHARHAVHKMDQIILDVPVDQREPFQAIRHDVATIEKGLFDMLFPRQPEKKPAREKPKG